MTSSIQRKSLSIIIVFALVVSMFSGLGGAASAAAGPGVPYVVTGTMTQLSANPALGVSGTVWSISNEGEMRDLIPYINSGSNSTGVTFFLTTDITLAAVWTPVGNGATHAFNGTFDGSNNDPTAPHTISDLTVSAGSGGSYYGLFGYSTGPILNVNVNGEIASPSTATSIEYVGGVVGYTTNDVYNCQANVIINVPNAQNVGGVVGAIENLAAVPIVSPFHVQASSSKANVTGESRVGGVVGAVYCNYAGNVVVDNCYYSNAGNPGNLNLTATANASREWSGGVVGYCRGYITNSYAVATLNSLNTGHYIAGIAGILQGTAPQATLSNSYAAVAFNSHDDPQYDRPLYSSADNSDTLPINNVLYDYSTSEEGKYSNVPGDGTNGWGYWQQTGYGTTVQLQNYDQQLEMVYNGSTQIKPSPTTQAVLGSAFAKDDGATFYNGRYPILIWQSSLLNLPTYVPGDGTLNPPYEVGVFIDGVNGSDSNSGTSWTDPVLTVARALAVWAGGEATSNIYVLNTVTLTDGNALNLSGTAFEGVRFMRSASFAGVLFNVPGNVNAMMSAVLIDGNNTNISATKSLFDVTGGTLTVGFKAGLVNNVSSDGGAINVSSGSAAVTSGQLYNNYARRGGAVYVVEGASFTLNGTDGQINYNTAQNIGGAIASRGTVVIANGTITRNAVDSPGVGSGAYGGAIAAMGGSVTISGGTITYNSVISGNEGNSYGGAIYVDDTDGEGTTVAISGGNLNYNIALSGDNGKAYGGGLAFVNGYATISGGYLMENIVNVGSGIYAFGGGVYIAPGLTLNLNGGTIFGGIATRGQGIYADYSNSSGNTYIILNPTGSSVVSVSDTVYLITGALITQSGARFSIPNPLPASSISTPFSVQVDYPVQNVLVALAGTSSIASDSVQYFKTWRGVSMMVIANGIFYNSYDLAIE